MTDIVKMTGEYTTLSYGNYEVSLPAEYAVSDTDKLIAALKIMSNLEAECGYKFNRVLTIQVERVLH